jgi:hypothetical protein
MFRCAALPFSLLVLVHTLMSYAPGHDHAAVVVTSQQSKEPPTSASACHESSFSGRINGGEKYSRELGERLWVRFAPTKSNWGWAISVEPEESTDDYAWPVNPPLQSGNSQYLSTGYGESVGYQLQHDHRIFFVLNRTVYEEAIKLVNDEAYSKEAEGARRYLAALPNIPTGILYVKPIKFEVVNEGNAVNWMEYSITAITPASFHLAAGLNPKGRPCPPMHWVP